MPVNQGGCQTPEIPGVFHFIVLHPADLQPMGIEADAKDRIVRKMEHDLRIPIGDGLIDLIAQRDVPQGVPEGFQPPPKPPAPARTGE